MGLCLNLLGNKHGGWLLLLSGVGNHYLNHIPSGGAGFLRALSCFSAAAYYNYDLLVIIYSLSLWDELECKELN